MELNNIEKAKAIFPDAVKLQLRIDKPSTVADIRCLLPNSVVLLSCKISKNYAKVIYSEGAAHRLFPDISKFVNQVKLGDGHIVYIYQDEKKKGAKLLTDFHPISDKKLMTQLEFAFGERMYQTTNYPECSMGCIFFKNTSVEDIVRILTLSQEVG